MDLSELPSIDSRQSTINYVAGHQYNLNSRPESTEQTLHSFLRPASMDVYGRLECLPGTRVALIEYIVKWALGLTTPHSILWLYGLAGAGKSTLATTVAKLFREQNNLGAFMFFDRDMVERSDPAIVMKTLAYQIGLFHPLIGRAVSETLEISPGILLADPSQQFQRLAVDPLIASEFFNSPQAHTPIFIIFDGLDECGTALSRSVLLKTLAKMTVNLTIDIRVLITSRPERDIHHAFIHQSHILTKELEIHTDGNINDISTYVKYQMSRMREKSLGDLPADWPSELDVSRLAERACGLFIWASTAIQFIDGFNPRKRMDAILRGEVALKSTDTLDLLYRTALDSVGDWEDEDFTTVFRAVTGIILVAQRPLSSICIDSLLSVDRGSSFHAISHLGCVVQMKPTVRFLHPSFADFLLTRSRCGRNIWTFDEQFEHRTLGLHCLSLLRRTLKRNICDITLSTNLLDETLPEHVIYASIHWIDHVCYGWDDTSMLMEHLSEFLCTHLLHWFEAMSILRKSRDTIQLLGRLLQWAKTNYPGQDKLLELVYDASRFAKTFASSIEDHPLLVYHAALPFTPRSCQLFKLYSSKESSSFLLSGYEQSWSPVLMILNQEPDGVSAIFSPDGTRIASLHNEMIRVWHAETGIEVAPVLRGHEAAITSIAFSPDSSRIVSGSSDKSIRIWDAGSGIELVFALRGHQGEVNSVVFSPGGELIVSASSDKTIRMWDAGSGTEVVDALRGHEDTVTSVAFSPDGRRIVSGSRDTTIRVWDAGSGVEIAPVIKGHKNWVNAVSFSPDGTLIVSGSSDNTIRVWDVGSGVEVVPALRGHNDAVMSVSFSPNGNIIASGSCDKTIRVWDTRSGKEAIPALEGHEDVVRSVAFSPNGNQIVSASDDEKIRVWDLWSRVVIAPALQGHEGAVASIAFSPDGSRMVSGSLDKTIRVWDANSGVEVGPTLRGHEDALVAVAFSPDGNRIVSASEDETIRVWDLWSGAEVIPAIQVDDFWVYEIAFSSDGSRILASKNKTSGYREWDAYSGDRLFYHPNNGNIPSFVDVTDGDRVRVSGAPENMDNSIITPSSSFKMDDDGIIIHLPTGRTISKIPNVIDSCCFTSHGNTIAIGTNGGRVILMNVPLIVLDSRETRSGHELDGSSS